ncbi:MAG: small ribosomal subunit Rsm22 family protein [Eubacteriales bacterium]|nr:small ribosomal subunit Rsm22 family protein [Eubacteriales bacterium]
MELPQELRLALERETAKVKPNVLKNAVALLSQRYREESGMGKRLVLTQTEVLAYSAVRMPATYSAVAAVLSQLNKDMVCCKTMLDAGAGTGAAAWAAAAAFPSLQNILCVDRENAMLTLCQRYLSGSSLQSVVHTYQAELTEYAPSETYDLVTASYALNEFDEATRLRTIDKLWDACGQFFVLIEPGTPTAFGQLRAAREHLLQRGGTLIAPCPHLNACPMAEEDWCHFTCRLSRSRLHKQLKGGDAPYEDEKYAYLIFSKTPVQELCYGRVLRHPQVEAGKITLTLCTKDGLRERVIRKKDGEAFKAARKASCGDAIDF